MKSNIFSYDYYKTNAKLEAFVYKRFVFKMERMDYTIDVEDISDKSFTVKSCFMNYGLGVGVDKNISYSEKINYSFEFFNDKELQIKLMEIARKEKDSFLIIREIYESSNNRDQAVIYISDYVKKQALELNYIENLKKFINDNGFNNYYGLCHNFSTTSQIRDWLYKLYYQYKNDVKEDVNKEEEKEENKEENKEDIKNNYKDIKIILEKDNFIDVNNDIDIDKIIQCRDMSSDMSSFFINENENENENGNENKDNSDIFINTILHSIVSPQNVSNIDFKQKF
jgi:hypothetical protein